MYLDVNLALDLHLQRLSHGLKTIRKGSEQAVTQCQGPGNFETHTVMSSDLVELHKDLDGELWADGSAGDELVQRLGEAGANGGPPIQLEGGHPLHATPRHAAPQKRQHTPRRNICTCCFRLANEAVVMMARMIRVRRYAHPGNRIAARTCLKSRSMRN